MQSVAENLGRTMDTLLDRMSALRMAVVGDVILDRFLYGSVERISPEAPVPVVDVSREVYHLGGAANVVNNLRALGAGAELVAVVGEDARADTLRNLLAEAGAGSGGLVNLDNRPTALKTRVIAQHQQVVRFDREVRGEVDEPTRKAVLTRVESMIDGIDGVIVSDYGKGVITRELMGELVAMARAKGIRVVVDPKPVNVDCYRGVDAITPNVKEVEGMTGLGARTDTDASTAGRKLLERCEANSILLTRGERGMTLIRPDADDANVPTFARDVFDVTGAGDTAISTFTLAWAAGATPEEAAFMANLASGIVVGKLGTATPTVRELKSAFTRGITGH